jgi:hypothetical protein
MSFDPADPVGSVFADIMGKPAWQVKKGYGSFVTLEFGEPRLEFREPYASRAKSERVRQLAARRLVTVRGDWHLWIYCCEWEISQAGQRLAHSESKDARIERAAGALDGQILTAVTVDPETAATRLEFDLGGVLETRRWTPRRKRYEQWILHAPEDRYLSQRDDARYSWSGPEIHDEQGWLPLP